MKTGGEEVHKEAQQKPRTRRRILRMRDGCLARPTSLEGKTPPAKHGSTTGEVEGRSIPKRRRLLTPPNKFWICPIVPPSALRTQRSVLSAQDSAMTIEEADLCPFCVALVEAVAAASDTKLAISANPLTYEQLLSSADTCRLCREFASGWSTAAQFQLEHARQSLAGQVIRIASPVSSHAVVEPGVPWKRLHAEIHSPASDVYYLMRSTMAVYSSKTRLSDTLSQLPASLPTQSLLAEKARAIGLWLNECRNGSQHSSCQPAPFLPSRLISVGLDGQPPRLVAAKDGSFSSGGVEYATLSHCWGGTVPLRTTRSNLGQHLKEIPPNTIPPTFAEAMQIARDIKIPYMWIDSLCIVQDDLQDWQAEASQMDKIYGGSQLTIAAAQSQTSQDGCFPSRKWPVEESVFRRRGSDLVVRHCFDDLRLRPVENVLGTRAWTLQEHMLSPRLVSCQQPEMHWQCRTVHKGESGLSFSLELDEGQMSQNFPRTLPKLSQG